VRGYASATRLRTQPRSLLNYEHAEPLLRKEVSDGYAGGTAADYNVIVSDVYSPSR